MMKLNEETKKAFFKLNLELNEGVLKLTKVEDTLPEGTYAVTADSISFRLLADIKLLAGPIFKGDLFELMGDECKKFQGEIYRKVKIKKAFFEAMEGQLGWIPVEGTTAPKTPIIRKTLHGYFLIQKEAKMLDCNSLADLGYLKKGDSVDIIDSDEDIFTCNSYFRKVTIQDCQSNEDMIGKVVWLEILQITQNQLFSIKENTKLYEKHDLESEIGILSEGDQFLLLEDSLKQTEGKFLKRVQIIVSDTSCDLIGWLDLSTADVLVSTIIETSNPLKRITNTDFCNIYLERDILAHELNQNELHNAFCIEKGSCVKLFDLKDSFGRYIIETSVTTEDGFEEARYLGVDMLFNAQFKKIFN